jgi:hypothetical protein
MSALETGAFERPDFDSGWRNFYYFHMGRTDYFGTGLCSLWHEEKVTLGMIVDENTIDLFGVGISRTDGEEAPARA